MMDGRGKKGGKGKESREAKRVLFGLLIAHCIQAFGRFDGHSRIRDVMMSRMK